MTFGVSVAAYNKKPSTLTTKPINPANEAANNISSPTGTATTSQVAQPQVTPTKTALGGSTAPVASGLVNNVQSPIYQPLFSGQMGDKSDSIYGRLNAINQTTQSLDDYTQAKVASQNSRINSWNRRMQANASSTGDFFGGGDAGLDNEQMDNARAIATIGKQRGMDDQGIQIALMTALTESGLRNLNHGDRDSVGLFQQRTSQGWGSVDQIMDRNYSAGKFYDSLAKTNYKAMNPWQAAQAVQRSFDPTGSNYQKTYAQAQRAYAAIFQPNNIKSNDAAGWLRNMTGKYVDLDGKFGAQCVDLYNAYTSNFVGGKNFMVGYAPEIFNNYDAGAYRRYSSNQTPGRMGDVAVFNRGNGTPLGHVGIVIGDNGDGTLRMLSANYGNGPSGSMNTAIHNISKATLMGYLRPNKLG